MAQLAVAAAGALVLGPAGLALTTAGTGFMLGSMAYSLLAPGQKSYGPRLNDLKITGTDYGSPIPWLMGSPRVAGQIIWASERRETASTESQGKGGGPSYTSYTYDVDLLILVSENIITGVGRVWSSGDLIVNNETVREGLWVDMRVYTGEADQLPDPTYEAAVGLGNAPAYRGMGTILIQGLQLGNSGNLPNLTFEVGVGSRILVTKVLHDFDGFYDQGQGAFCNQEAHPFPPASDVVVHTRLPDPEPGSTYTISKTVSVLPGFPVTIDVYHDNYAQVWIDGVELELTQLGDFNSVGHLVPTGRSIQVVLTVTEATESGSFNYIFAAFRVSQQRYAYQGSRDEPVPLADAVSALMYRAGYGSEDFDVSGIDADRVVRALAVSQVGSTRAALEVLMQAHFLEVSADDKIRFRQRAVDPVCVIPFADLGMGSDVGGDDEPLAVVLGNDLELPAQLALSYPNMDGDYQAATEYSDRLLSGQVSTETITTALGMTPTEAKGVVDGLLMDKVAGLATATLKLPLKYARLEPGDVVEVLDRDGRSYRLRIQTKKDTLPILEFACVLDDVGAIDSAAITDSGYVGTQTVIQPAGTRLAALDIPILRDADDAPGYYVAVAPVRASDTDKWPGALVAQSWNGVDYAQLLTTPVGNTLGQALTALGDWAGPPVFDEASTVTVQIEGDGELASSTREAMLLDETVNALLLGSEVLRFRSAALVSEGVYLLSGLLRGQRGTEWAMGTHAVGERCVLLGNALRRVVSQTSELGLARELKAVTLGTFLSAGEAQGFTDTGVGLKPFSPANPRALPDGDGLALSWQRRTRHSYQYAGDTPVVPLGEAAEAYRVRVLDGDTVLRTETVAAPQYRYSAALQAADGVASGTALTFEICQLSATVGAGYPATVGAITP